MALGCAREDCSEPVAIAPTGVYPRVPQAKYCSRRCRSIVGTRRYYQAHKPEQRARVIAYQARDRVASRRRAADYKARNPEKQAAWVRAARLKANYGLTVEDYDRMYAAQDGLCAICRQPETGRSRAGAVRRLAVDHDHATGRVRGLLCSRCNSILGFIESDLHQAALSYLERRPVEEVA